MNNKALYTTPQVIEDTAAGKMTTRIVDEMFRDREVNCIGEIDADLTYSLCLQLRYLAKQDPDAEITLYINSPGGEVSSGLAVYDVMKSISCPVRTVCTGMAASMASILFMAGDQRDMLPHSQLMIHDPLVGSIGGSALSVKAKSDSLMRTREITANIISKCTGHSLEEVYEATAHDTYFEAEEAVEWGLADGIIHEL